MPKQFLEVVKYDEFLSLSHEEVIQLISCSYVTVPFEENQSMHVKHEQVQKKINKNSKQKILRKMGQSIMWIQGYLKEEGMTSYKDYNNPSICQFIRSKRIY